MPIKVSLTVSIVMVALVIDFVHFTQARLESFQLFRSEFIAIRVLRGLITTTKVIQERQGEPCRFNFSRDTPAFAFIVSNIIRIRIFTTGAGSRRMLFPGRRRRGPWTWNYPRSITLIPGTRR